MVMIHGGSFRHGARDASPWPGFATSMAAAGYAVASIDYRREGDHPVPSPPFAEMMRDPGAIGFLNRTNDDGRSIAAVSAFEDTAKAMHWRQDNAARYCIDTGKIALWGSSAGAIAALHTAYSLDDYGIEMPSFSAVVDLWGGLPVDAHREAGEASLLIVHGTQDRVVPYKETREIKARAKAVGIPVEVYAVKGAGHGFSDIHIRTRKVDGITLFDRIHAFLDRALMSDWCHRRGGSPCSCGQPAECPPGPGGTAGCSIRLRRGTSVCRVGRRIVFA